MQQLCLLKKFKENIIKSYSLHMTEAEKTRMKQKYQEKKNAANKAVGKARHKKQQDWWDRIEEDSGKN